MFSKPIHEIIYSLPENQKIEFPKEITNDSMIKFIHGIPIVTETFNKEHNHLWIIDDQSSNANEEVSDLFTRISHHFSISVILLTQNLFSNNCYFRTISLNAHYIIIFKSPRSQDQIRFLSRQICPTTSKFFIDSYTDCCREPYSYFLIDLTQNCNEDLRYRTKIFPDDNNTIVYKHVETRKYVKKR